MKDRKKAVKAVIITAISLIVVYIFFQALSGFLFTSQLFNVKTVTTNDRSIDLTYLLGKNIFTLDLEREAQKLLNRFQDYNRIYLVRRLPDSIAVYLKKREPLAYVRLYRYFAVDQYGVLFDTDNKDGFSAQLPIIFGLENKIFGPKPGKSYRDVRELLLCLDLIREIKSVGALRKCAIKRIDVASPAQLSFYWQYIEVKIGESNISQKLRLLSSILTQLGADLPKIKYIDLRFKDPVIKYK